MAYADYRLCDNCGEKAFYDAELDYRQTSRQDPIEHDERAKQVGERTSYRLQYLGVIHRYAELRGATRTRARMTRGWSGA